MKKMLLIACITLSQHAHEGTVITNIIGLEVALENSAKSLVPSLKELYIKKGTERGTLPTGSDGQGLLEEQRKIADLISSIEGISRELLVESLDKQVTKGIQSHKILANYIALRNQENIINALQSLDGDIKELEKRVELSALASEVSAYENSLITLTKEKINKYNEQYILWKLFQKFAEERELAKKENRKPDYRTIRELASQSEKTIFKKYSRFQDMNSAIERIYTEAGLGYTKAKKLFEESLLNEALESFSKDDLRIFQKKYQIEAAQRESKKPIAKSIDDLKKERETLLAKKREDLPDDPHKLKEYMQILKETYANTRDISLEKAVEELEILYQKTIAGVPETAPMKEIESGYAQEWLSNPSKLKENILNRDDLIEKIGLDLYAKYQNGTLKDFVSYLKVQKTPTISIAIAPLPKSSHHNLDRFIMNYLMFDSSGEKLLKKIYDNLVDEFIRYEKLSFSDQRLLNAYTGWLAYGFEILRAKNIFAGSGITKNLDAYINYRKVEEEDEE